MVSSIEMATDHEKREGWLAALDIIEKVEPDDRCRRTQRPCDARR